MGYFCVSCLYVKYKFCDINCFCVIDKWKIYGGIQETTAFTLFQNKRRKVQCFLINFELCRDLLAHLIPRVLLCHPYFFF